MNITTKHDIGQEVWVLINGVPKNGVVKNIVIPESRNLYYEIMLYETPYADLTMRRESERVSATKEGLPKPFTLTTFTEN